MQGVKGRRLRSGESDNYPCPTVWVRVLVGGTAGQGPSPKSYPRPLEDLRRRHACSAGPPSAPLICSGVQEMASFLFLCAYFFRKCPLQMADSCPCRVSFSLVLDRVPVFPRGIGVILCVLEAFEEMAE